MNWCRSTGWLLLSVLSLPISAQTTAQVNAPVVATAEGWALGQLVEVLKQTQTLQADVEQLLMDQEGREIQETRAMLTMQKPARFRWEVTQPFSELMVTDGDTIWRYEPDLEQVTVQKFDAELDRTPVMLLNGSEETISNAYSVSAATLLDGRQTLFTLIPKQSDSLFERMSLTFEGETLLEMHFEDSLGQRTTLTFHNSQRNATLPESLFGFEVPTGVEVIDGRLD